MPRTRLSNSFQVCLFGFESGDMEGNGENFGRCCWRGTTVLYCVLHGVCHCRVPYCSAIQRFMQEIKQQQRKKQKYFLTVFVVIRQTDVKPAYFDGTLTESSACRNALFKRLRLFSNGIDQCPHALSSYLTHTYRNPTVFWLRRQQQDCSFASAGNSLFPSSARSARAGL